MSGIIDLDRRQIRVNGSRLLDWINRLRQAGRTAAGGVNRMAFTVADVEGRALVTRTMVEAGLDVRVDAAGNLIGTRPGSDAGAAALLLGSHIDTVPDGGALDGAYGVLAAVEVLHTLADHGVMLPRSVAVVAFADEEGTQGTPGMWGSHAFVGALRPADLVLRDSHGTSMRELVARVGGDLSRIDEARWAAGRIAAYLELHIEQGPVLEQVGAEIGVVQAITGRLSVDVTVRGETNHAGTTPMELRRDALVGAARMVVGVQRLAGPHGPVRVATVGCIGVEPNASNVVPGVARLRVDLRDVSAAAVTAGLAQLRAAGAELAAETGMVVDVRPDQQVAAVSCDPRLQELVADAARDLGLRRYALPSGAGHDAQVIGTVAPIGMIFVPSVGGLSHAPAEDTDRRHLVAGADVLLRTVLAFDGLDAPSSIEAGA